MKRKIFGTDGVRGKANLPPITAEVALRLGLSAGHYFKSALGTKRVVIGKDTRRSGYMLENALTAGFTSVGMNVFLLGPLPTPAIGMLNLYAGMPDIVVGFFFSSNIFRMILSAAKEREKDGAVNIG